MAKRHTSVADVVSGHEPTGSVVNAKADNYTISLIKTFNWYSAHRGPNDARKYLVEAAKAAKHSKARISALSALSNNEVPLTLAWGLRILGRGATLKKSDAVGIVTRLKDLYGKIDQQVAEKPKAVDEAPTKTVQEYMAEKIVAFLGEMEGVFDDWCSDASIMAEPKEFYKYLQAQQVPQPYVKEIEAWCDAKIKEYGVALTSKDDQIKEGYSNFSREGIGMAIKWFAALKQQATEYGQFKKVNRAPRKRKAKPAAVQVAKLKYKTMDDAFKLSSVQPAEIIGAEQLWTFNTKTRVMAVYRASGATGLAVKGTTIINFDTEISQQKKIRKPETMLKELVDAGKVQLRKFMDKVKAVAKVPNGRVNKDTILVRVVQ